MKLSLRTSMTASQEAAASAAAHKVLVTLFPANAETFEELHKATLAGIRHGPHKRRGLEWGESVADQILLWRASNNSAEPPIGQRPPRKPRRTTTGRVAADSACLPPIFVAALRTGDTVRDSDRRFLRTKRPSRPRVRKVRGGLQRGEGVGCGGRIQSNT
jgi:hypothetical protein